MGFKSGDDEGDEKVTLPGSERMWWGLAANCDGSEDEDGKEEEQNSSPFPDVDRKRSEDGDMEESALRVKTSIGSRYEAEYGEQHHRS